MRDGESNVRDRHGSEMAVYASKRENGVEQRSDASAEIEIESAAYTPVYTRVEEHERFADGMGARQRYDVRFICRRCSTGVCASMVNDLARRLVLLRKGRLQTAPLISLAFRESVVTLLPRGATCPAHAAKLSVKRIGRSPPARVRAMIWAARASHCSLPARRSRSLDFRLAADGLMVWDAPPLANAL